MRIRVLLCALLLVLAGAPAAASAAPAPVPAATTHTVTLVNATGQTVWVGSNVNADGSAALTGMPTLAPGGSATVSIPEDTGAMHWRGKFFARQGCSGQNGTTFHCEVGDCGPYADHCTTGEQPVSLAEFNFDPSDSLAPWYDVSYVNAFSVPVTITPDGVSAPPAGGGECAVEGCPDDLLPYCPQQDLVTDPGTGAALECVNPSRDATSSYSDAITAHCPYAYAWSGQDTVPGNQVMRQCPECSGLTVTFH
ncbi:thaumatin family protein [Streptantibioticus silvisoli]|uniref:Thaumatin family protein n=1 Tax=Streptantibioticus silvisoli TaxID=2705255 RepID=A0ABT6VWT0_9ACTN|nr:thaumatin family protein [Streptantibioticus silvisoli]MDI5962192.1 thaumatin family protein [Streptantibioticus silvisoli]